MLSLFVRMTNMRDFDRVVYEEIDRLGGGAYGVPVWRAVADRLGRVVSYGDLWWAIERLEQEGWIRSQLGEATPERGNRRKRYYYVARRP
jgi:PadR family transcriptional regulator, regulatory protein PadR